MIITKDTLLHLNTTLYFDDEGFSFDTLEEAREHSLTGDTKTIRKQDCYIKHFGDLNEEQQEYAKEYCELNELGDKYKEMLYLVTANLKEILLIIEDWAEFEYYYSRKIITTKEVK